MSIMSRLQ